jgi:hypothetical protein
MPEVTCNGILTLQGGFFVAYGEAELNSAAARVEVEFSVYLFYFQTGS